MAATNIAFKDVVRSSTTEVAGNSTTILQGDPVVIGSTGKPVKVNATGKIVGIANNKVTAASDNETVGLLTVNYTRIDGVQFADLPISGGTITVADEGKYFNFLSNGTAVDGATESTIAAYVDTVAGTAFDPVLTYQVRLQEFKSATLGTFQFV